VSAPSTAGRDHGSLSVRTATLDDLAIVIELRLALLAEHSGSPLYGRLREDVRERAAGSIVPN